MIPVFQTRFGRQGNCWPACIASLFEVSLEEVDHLSCQFPGWRELTDAWLAERGLYFVEVPWVPENEKGDPFPITCPPEGTLVIAGCWSNRNLPHVVIARVQIIRRNEHGHPVAFGLELVHDPHPEGAFSRVDGIMMFAKLFLG